MLKAKLLYRRGQALAKVMKYEEALSTLNDALHSAHKFILDMEKKEKFLADIERIQSKVFVDLEKIKCE